MLLERVQLAANITEMPGGMCERQLIMPRLFTCPPAGDQILSILDTAVSSSFHSRPISQTGSQGIRGYGKAKLKRRPYQQPVWIPGKEEDECVCREPEHPALGSEQPWGCSARAGWASLPLASCIQRRRLA